jgi:hypothetical protein
MQTLGRPPPVAPPLYAIKGVITAMQRPNLSASHGGALQLGQQAARARRLVKEEKEEEEKGRRFRRIVCFIFGRLRDLLS